MPRPSLLGRARGGRRQAGTLSEDDWWDLHLSVHGGFFGSRGGARLPDKLLRLSVRYADGRKATTIGAAPAPDTDFR